jgi:hypothetical protein
MALYGMLVFFPLATLVVLAAACGAVLTFDKTPLSLGGLAAIGGFMVWNLELWAAFRNRSGAALRSSVALFDVWAFMQDMAIGFDRVFELPIGKLYLARRDQERAAAAIEGKVGVIRPPTCSVFG